MTTKFARSFCLLSACLGLAVLPAARSLAQNAASAATETFGVFRGNAQHSGFIDFNLSPKLALAWQNSEPRFTGSVSAPVVDAARVYYGLGPHLYALDVATGAVQWQYPTDASTQIGAFNAPLALDGANVFAGNDDGNLYCFDAQKGTITWQFKTGGSVHTAPVVQDGVVYLASQNQVYAVDEKTGQAVWQQPFATDTTIVSAPSLGNDVIYEATGSGRIYAIHMRSGSLFWSNQITGSPTESGALVVNRGLAYILGDQLIDQLSPRMGDVRQQYLLKADNMVAPTIGDDGIIYAGTSDSKISALDNRGRAIWQRTLDDHPSAPPLLTRGELITCTQSGTIYLLNRATGAIDWVYTLQPVVTLGDTAPPAAPVIVSPTVANGSLYILSDDGTLSAFRPAAPDNSGPVVTALYPAPDSTISGEQIAYQIVIDDIGCGVKPGSATLTVDGQDIPVQYDPSANMVHVKAVSSGVVQADKVPIKLATLSDGLHKAVLIAADWRGNKVTKTWSFTVDKTQPAPTQTPAPQQVATSNISADSNAPAPLEAATPPSMPTISGEGLPPAPKSGSSSASTNGGGSTGGAAGPPTPVNNSSGIATGSPASPGGGTTGGGTGTTGTGTGGTGTGGAGGGPAPHGPPPLPPGL